MNAKKAKGFPNHYWDCVDHARNGNVIPMRAYIKTLQACIARIISQRTPKNQQWCKSMVAYYSNILVHCEQHLLDCPEETKKGVANGQ